VARTVASRGGAVKRAGVEGRSPLKGVISVERGQALQCVVCWLAKPRTRGVGKEQSLTPLGVADPFGGGTIIAMVRRRRKADRRAPGGCREA